MLIEDMLNKRDMATNICVTIQNSIGKDRAGVFTIEDFENRNNEEFRNYCISEMQRLNLDTMIFTGWAFTKEYFNHLLSYEQFESNSEFKVLIFPEIITHIVFKNEGALRYGLNKINNDYKKLSSLNINTISISDNAVEINYFTNTSVKYFEEKPKAIQEIIEERK